jgi:ABC-type multidrug transport system ATPase subunit
MTDAVIETGSLCRRFGDKDAVCALNIEVPAGSVYGFLGPNGAGKTTTIRMLLGLLQPTSGTIRLFGEPAGSRALLRRIGALVESPSLYPHLTGEENLRHACLLKDVPRRDIARVLEIVTLQDAAHRLVRNYSLGMKQRLALAQALLGRPHLVVLDEPTNGLDPAGIREMRHLLRNMPATHGVTVFLSSHLLSEVEQIATRVGILAGGRLQFQGSPEELRAHRGGALRIGVDTPAVALAALNGRGYDASAESSGTIVLPPCDPAAAAAINRLLVEHGVGVHSIACEQASLEKMFLELTNSI